MPNHLHRPFDLRTAMTCDACGRRGRPLLRVYGMPGPDVDWERHVQEGRYTLMGCVVTDDDAPYECRHCGMDTYVWAEPHRLDSSPTA